jgi:hypothetical protein
MTNFEQGGLYYILWYGDDSLLLLSPEAVVFIGKNLDPTDDRDEEAWYFQDVRSYCVQPMSSSSPLLPDSNGIPVGTYARFRAHELSQLTDLAGLSEEIKNCQARRRAAGLTS